MTGSRFRRYLLPGLVFQSVVIAGGYGTGREIVEFFLALGPRGGLAAMAVSTLIWSVVCAVSYEFARVHRAYEYRTFFERLIGPGAWVYEVTYYAFMLLVLAVVAAAAGEIFRATFGLDFRIGVTVMSVLIAALVVGSTAMIERVLSLWSAVLYAVFLTMFVWAVAAFGPEIGAMLAGDAAEPAAARRGWLTGGVAYAGYNLAIIPALLFTVRHVSSRREAVAAGLAAGPIAMMPALLFFIAMTPLYPAINQSPVPANDVLEALGSRTFQVAFQVMLLGTLIETGTGMIHAVNERVGEYLARRRGGPEPASPAAAGAAEDPRPRAGEAEVPGSAAAERHARGGDAAVRPGSAAAERHVRGGDAAVRPGSAAATDSGTAPPSDPAAAFSRRGRLALAVVWLALAAGAARFGLIDLIARGYGTMTWLFIAIYVVPVLTVGVWRVRGARVHDA